MSSAPDPGQPSIVLLHGLGATSGVWDGVIEALRSRSIDDIQAPDLPGHGTGVGLPDYSFKALAEVIAADLPADRPIVIVGHSLGGVIALTLAAGRFGVPVVGAVGIGIKVSWSPEELDRAGALAERPIRWFDQRTEALDRFVAVAGLKGLVSAEQVDSWRGVCSDGGGYRLAQDPATNAAGDPDMVELMATARCRVQLACGARDPMVTLDELRRFDSDARHLDGGHNVHVENPDAVADLILAFSHQGAVRP